MHQPKWKPFPLDKLFQEASIDRNTIRPNASFDDVICSFSESELVRVMSFVSIPALVGPMLVPVAGGLIVRYLHWRVIFFVNLSIGILGLVMVYLHLPDYREEKTPPLDLVGLILF